MGRLFELTVAVEAASRRHEWDALRSFYADDVTAWAPSYEVSGSDAMLEMSKAQNGPFDDIRTEATLIVETEDTVVTEWTWSIPHPSGVGRASVRGLSYVVFEGDRAKTIRQYWDQTEFNRQLEADAGVE